MLGSEILDVAIGIIFVYLLMSIICSAIREGLEGLLKTRAAYLERGIRELLHDRHAAGAAKELFRHPLIYSLFNGDYKPQPHTEGKPRTFARGGTLPSYIPSKNFATALMDLAARGPVGADATAATTTPIVSLETIRANVTKLGNPALQRVVMTALDTAQGDINRLQANLERWYDSGMDRVSGWYKRSTQWIVFWTALVVTVVMNVNTIRIADYLARQDSAREAIVQSASAAAQGTGDLTYDQAKTELQALKLPVGWSEGLGSIARAGHGRTPHPFDWVAAIFGWLMTAFASTLGAPFWFDVLNKVMVIRSTVKPHEKSPEEDSEDRQFGARQPLVPAFAAPGAMAGVMGGGFAAPPAAPPLPVPDPETEVDACDVDFTAADATADEQLPAAEGGVES